MIRHARRLSRRRFLRGLAVATTTGLLGLPRRSLAAERPSETKTLRLPRTAGLCAAPVHVAGDLLPAEGFTDVRYVATVDRTADALEAGAVDIGIDFIGPLAIRLDAGAQVLILAGAHVGCHEVFAGERVRSLADLRGKTVAVPALGSGEHIFLAAMLASVGVDPRRDVTWLSRPRAEAMRLLAEGAIDAVPTFLPTAYDFRARGVGSSLVNTSVDPPWSRHFCCMIAANRDFVRRHPAAAKRALRAILKGADLCALEPERVAGSLVDLGVTARRDDAVRTLKELSYGKWRDVDPEETVRFHAVQLRRAGFMTSSPERIVGDGTDWRFLNELRKELKG